MYLDEMPGEAGRAGINKSIKAANKYFDRADVKKEIESNCALTLKWLKLNGEHFKDGNRKRGPWLDTSVGAAVDVVKDPDDIDAHVEWRLDMLQDAITGNGLQKLIDLMLSKPALGFPCHDKVLESAVAFNGIKFHGQLAGFKRTGLGGMSLTAAARKFDYGQAARMRDALLAGMVELGLWHVLPAKAENEPYVISIGPVAWAFQKKVLQPAKKHFSSNPIFK